NPIALELRGELAYRLLVAGEHRVRRAVVAANSDPALIWSDAAKCVGYPEAGSDHRALPLHAFGEAPARRDDTRAARALQRPPPRTPPGIRRRWVLPPRPV